MLYRARKYIYKSMRFGGRTSLPLRVNILSNLRLFLSAGKFLSLTLSLSIGDVTRRASLPVALLAPLAGASTIASSSTLTPVSSPAFPVALPDALS